VSGKKKGRAGRGGKPDPLPGGRDADGEASPHGLAQRKGLALPVWVRGKAAPGVGGGRAAAWVALVVFVAALVLALGPARVTSPDSVFPKYLAAAAAPAPEQAERLLDYSPLYLSLTRIVASHGWTAVLQVQVVLHALTAALVALAVARLAGLGWALAAGLGAAAYRPFLVYAGVHEPESVIVFCLAVAVLAGLAARGRRNEQPGLPFWLWTTLAAAALAAAGLARPQHLLLLPVWAFWMSAGLPRSLRLRVWGIVLGIGLLLVGPVLASRYRATGMLAVMNPGPVFYEGNAPGAIGMARFAPPAVLALERIHPEAFDYGHVAYRRIAAAATGRPASPSSANRYWTGLALEGMRAHPGAALRRLVRKAGLALMPYEAHDLVNAEQNDRRLRLRFPWGFGLLLVPLAWLPFARRERLAELAGPLAIGLLALLLQIGLYASARQRLPLALALWVVGPVLASDLVRRRLRGGVRPVLLVLLGLAVSALLGGLTGGVAMLDQLGWDRAVGPVPAAWGERLVAWQEGRALRPVLRQDAVALAAGVGALRSGRPDLALPHLAPLVPGDRDLTIDDRTVGVPAYQAALGLLALGDIGAIGDIGDMAAAREAAEHARQVRPEDQRIAALVLRIVDPAGFSGAGAGGWRLPGGDPVSARLALAAAAAADQDRAASRALLQQLARDFPELAPR
jgi:hypothetical protein